MDSDNVDVVDLDCQNGGYHQHIDNDISHENGAASDNNMSKTIDEGIDSMEPIRTVDYASNGADLNISKDGEVNEAGQSKPRNDKVKAKNEKPSRTKPGFGSSVKKSNAETTSTLANGLHPKQPIKNRSLNDGNVNAAKQTGKSSVASSEGPVERVKLKPVKKGPLNKPEAEAESSSPTETDAKPRKVGALPNYGFSFRCDERAEKRKEFYSKVEELIQAKEEEKHSLQAKSKETQEAELKMLRKRLTFKATPMPNFYQEPSPAKTELKKIPPTRPKSPKLGRRKSSSPADAELNGSLSSQTVRLSLDEKVLQTNQGKGIPPVQTKKTIRKSLPKLPSEKSTLSKKTNEDKTPPRAPITEENDSSLATNEVEPNLTIPKIEEGEIHIHADNGSMVGEQSQTTFIEA